MQKNNNRQNGKQILLTLYLYHGLYCVFRFNFVVNYLFDGNT